MKSIYLKSTAITLFAFLLIYLLFPVGKSPGKKATPPKPTAPVVKPKTASPPNTPIPKSTYYIAAYYDGGIVCADCLVTDTSAIDEAEAALIEMGVCKDSIRWIQGGKYMK